MVFETLTREKRRLYIVMSCGKAQKSALVAKGYSVVLLILFPNPVLAHKELHFKKTH